MSVKALIKITNKDKKGKLIEYKIGETIENLTDEEEKRLVKIKAAETVLVAKDSTNTEQNNMNNNAQDNNSSGEGPSTQYPGA